MHARSALFDLYGDHLRARGSQAPVSAPVRLLAALGIAAPAVRTAVSRMVRQGWLAPVRLAGGPGYALTPRASQRLDEAAERIYRQGDQHWDGCWHLVVVERLREWARRERTRAGLRYLVHEWRKFLFSDPGLPAALLPPEWPGHDAARLFRGIARLWPAASRFVDCCPRADQPQAALPATGRDSRD